MCTLVCVFVAICMYVYVTAWIFENQLLCQMSRMKQIEPSTLPCCHSNAYTAILVQTCSLYCSLLQCFILGAGVRCDKVVDSLKSGCIFIKSFLTHINKPM